MPFLFALAARFGVPPAFQRFAAIGAVVMLAGLILSTVVRCHDARVIDGHDAMVEAATAKADRKADAAVAETRRSDDARRAQERTQLEKVTTDATSPTDARAHRLRCIRLQQDARAANREPPACDRPVVPGGAARAR